MPGFDCNRFPDLSVLESLSLAEGFKCGICVEVLDKAIDTRCGHTFCHECLNQWLSRPQTTKECPECRQSLVNRKRFRNETNDNNEVIIGGNILVDKNRRINGLIEKLRISCDYEWNGCPEVCPLESLSTHLKTCQYKTCQTCGLSVSPISDDHNCIEGLKKDRNEWQTKCNFATQRAKRIETQTKELKTKLEKSVEKALNLETKYKEMEKKFKDLETSVSTAEVEFPLTVTANCVHFGKCTASVGYIVFSDDSIHLHNVLPNDSDASGQRIMTIRYKDLQCLYACVDPTLPMLCIQPITQLAITIANILDFNTFGFNVSSIDPSEQFIIIELNEAINKTFSRQLYENCCQDNDSFDFREIDVTTGQLLQMRAKNTSDPFKGTIDEFLYSFT